jgi:putative ABC transport system permease protein
VTLYVAQVVAMALLASAAGALLGTALHALVPKVLPGLVPVGLVRPWQPAAWARVVMGVDGGACCFTLPLLVALRRVPPARVLRRDAEPRAAGGWRRALGALLVLAGVGRRRVSQAESLRYGTWFAGA